MNVLSRLAVLSLLVLVSAIGSANALAATETSALPASTTASPVAVRSMSSIELSAKMGAGWNLGNTLEAVGGETAWGNPKASQALINAVKAAGFKTIRIPVAWSQFSDPANFVIKDAWMARVEEVVNYALKADMVVLLNMHWDGGWMQPTYAKQASVNHRIKIMWTQIANRFKAYDERLIFAGTNEVMVDHDYGTPTPEYYTVQNSFNQTFVDTVRATGGANGARYLAVQSFNTNIDHAVKFAVMPRDTAKDKLLMEVHFYDPYLFTLDAKSKITQWGKHATDGSKKVAGMDEANVDAQFQKMKTAYVDRGIGVIVGEFGAVARNAVAGHEAYRIYWNQYVTGSAFRHQLVPVYWDNGPTGDNSMGLFDRASGRAAHPQLIQAVVDGAAPPK